ILLLHTLRGQGHYECIRADGQGELPTDHPLVAAFARLSREHPRWKAPSGKAEVDHELLRFQLASPQRVTASPDTKLAAAAPPPTTTVLRRCAPFSMLAEGQRSRRLP